MALEQGEVSARRWFAVTFAFVALLMSILAVGIATFADDGGGGSGKLAGGAPNAGTIELSDFKIGGDLMLPSGSSVTVVNKSASTTHNLAVAKGPTTKDLAPGESATLDLSSLKPGTYEVFCTISGHKEAGMDAQLMIHEGGATGSGSASGGGATATAADLKRQSDAMNASKLEPDGTKVFDLTAKITKWEVAKGQVVDAWTYNGTVPGPLIKVDVGDHVKVRLHNELPQATDLHIHGIELPNSMDGVAPITQPLIEPGETFTYDFVAERASVAMYHAHHMGNHQVPNGLLGVFLIGDMPIPTGRSIGDMTLPADLTVSQQIQMVLNDAGVIGLSLNGKSFPATQPYVGKVGDWVEVNYFNEGLMIHPMHAHQFTQVVIAKDGHPLDEPYLADTLNVAPGERYTVLMQLDKPGTWVWHCHILNHVESDNGIFGMLTAFVVT
jgi:hypothetical protein